MSTQLSSDSAPAETDKSPETSPASSSEEVQAITEATKEKKGCCVGCKGFFLYDVGRKDVQAFYFNQFGRSILFISFMFLSLGVLQLAYATAGCPQNPNGTYVNCGNKVYGMLPSDILAMMALIGGLSTAAFMPYAGAVVDFSDHRLAFGKVCATILVLINFVQIFIFESTWFAMVIAQAFFAASTFMANSMVLWSYVNAPSDHDLHGITSSGRLWETIAMLSFFIVVAVVQFATKWDSVSLARFAQALASVVGGICLFLSYKRYEPVKAVKSLEGGKSLYIAGIVEIAQTTVSLWKTEPSAFVYLLASMFTEAAISSFTNMSITYLAEQIEMTSTSIIIFIMINFATNPLGVMIHRYIARKIGHKKNYLLSVAYTLIITAFLVSFVYEPSHANIAYVFSVIYGVAYGWYYPSSNGYYVSLVPKERVTELWGFNSFCSVILSWAPPAIFIALNHGTGSLRLGLLGTMIFLFIGFCIACFIPERDETVAADEEEGIHDAKSPFEGGVDAVKCTPQPIVKAL
ncbi:hypothetical protein ACHAWT_006721 [Skeletonema menzelii]